MAVSSLHLETSLDDSPLRLVPNAPVQPAPVSPPAAAAPDHHAVDLTPHAVDLTDHAASYWVRRRREQGDQR